MPLRVVPDREVLAGFRAGDRPVVGFISTWPVYQGTTIDRHAHALLQGIRAAARDERCDLLLGVGVGVATPEGRWRSPWSVPASDSDLVPIGPWNTSGLIVVSDDLTDAQAAYLRDLGRGGLPIVCTTPEAPGPRVLADNAGGIRAAVEHLVAHGHRRIAFVAGRQHRQGDSAQRAHAFQGAMGDAGLEVDPALVAYGEHQRAGGLAAMQRILASGVPFSAFVASNDLSCLGAIEALTAAGLRVPEDVAAVGFDDILDARSHTPPLTTVRLPTFAVGYAALAELLGAIRRGDAATPDASTRTLRTEPTRLIVRRSCGCPSDAAVRPGAPQGGTAPTLAAAMAAVAFGEARTSTLEELEAEAEGFVATLTDALADGSDEPLRAGTRRLLGLAEARGEDPQAWQDALSVLYRDVERLRRLAPDADPTRLVRLLDSCRLEVSEHAQRGTSRAFLDHIGSMSQVALLTSELLATQDLDAMSAVLHQRLPALGIDAFLACRYVPDGDDPVARSEVILSHGMPGLTPGVRFPTRSFPPRPEAPDGPTEWQVLPLLPDEAITGFVAMSSHDLEPLAAIVSTVTSAIRTARLYREALGARRQAEEASAHRSRFLSMVSHELRTPLGVVVGLSDLILREAADGPALPPALRQDLERMATSAGHLGRLIDDVLDLASGQAGQLRLALEPVDLAEVLTRAATAGRELARSRDLEFRTDLPEQGPWVLGDATRLQQVMLNLIGNAVKFTDHGSIRLEAAVTADEGGARAVVISVTDTGLGVPADQRSTIFSEPHRGAAIGSTRRAGLGLGLAISRHLVELHEGSIGVESPGPDGTGSCFWFRLPVLVAGPNRPEKVLGPEANRQHLVLVVDDDPDTCALHARAVADAGARAIRVGDADAALDVLARERTDLVLLDLGLDGRDGFDVLDAMRARVATRAVPVIVITGRSIEDPDLARLRPGVAGVFQKGVHTTTELSGRIRAVLTGVRALPAPTQQLVRRAVSWIEAHHSEAVTRDDIARHVAISPDYLTDCFQQEMGMSPMTYLGRCRIRHARQLLESTDLSVTAVALSVGYSDVSHFTRTFHREVGVSPRVYRRGGGPSGITVAHPGRAQELPGR